MPIKEYTSKIALITGKSPEDIKKEMNKKRFLKPGLKPSVFCEWLEDKFALDFGQSMKLWKVFKAQGWIQDSEVRSKGARPPRKYLVEGRNMAKVKPTTKLSEQKRVSEFMKSLDHPLKHMAEELRQIILNTDPSIGEEILWRSPSFFYTGKMMPFKTREYKRTIVSINLVKKNRITLIFLKGGNVKDPSGLLEGTNSDGRRFAFFNKSSNVYSSKRDLERVVKDLLQQMIAN